MLQTYENSWGKEELTWFSDLSVLMSKSLKHSQQQNVRSQSQILQGGDHLSALCLYRTKAGGVFVKIRKQHWLLS